MNTFTLCVGLKTDTQLYGLTALDYRRLHGLPDDVHVRFGSETVSFSVEESVARGFARLFQNDPTVHLRVHASMLPNQALRVDPWGSVVIDTGFVPEPVVLMTLLLQALLVQIERSNHED